MIIAGRWLTSCFCIQRHADFVFHPFMATQPFKLHFAVTEQYFLRPPGLLSVTYMIRQSISGVDPPHHCELAVIYPQILDHRLSRVRSAADVFVLVDSLAEAFVCILLGTGGTPEVSILTFKRKPAFDVLLIRMAASRSTSKVGLRLSPLPLLTSMRKSGPSSQTRTRPAIEFVSGEEGPRPASSSISSSIRSLSTWT